MAAMIGRRAIEGAAGLTHAMKYCRAAQNEEKNGFAFTASVEWQKAAELLSPVPFLADRCWQQWERIMRLPRRLAAPISDTQTPSSAQFDVMRQAEYSPSQPDEFVAHVAEVLFSDHALDQIGVELPTMASVECMVAAA